MGACSSKQKKRPIGTSSAVSDVNARGDEQNRGPRDIFDSDRCSSTEMGAVSTKQEKGPIGISSTVADVETRDEQKHRLRDDVDSDRGGSTERHSEDAVTNSAVTALQKVYSVLVEYMEPDPVLDKLLDRGFPRITVRDIREEQLTSNKNRKLIELVQRGGHEVYSMFKSCLSECGQGLICTLLERAEKGENTLDLQQELSEEVREKTKPESEHNKLYKDLKDDLITYYRDSESHIPASPLVDEYSVPIEELYVLPPIWAYEEPYFFGTVKETQKEDKTYGNGVQDKRKISIRQLFLCGDVRYRKIYITANAGFGKTSLSQKLTMTWCQGHLPLTSLTENYEFEELAAMKYFDLLFLLHLRDYQSVPICNLDDLIIQMVSEKLSRNALYTKEFVQKMLHQKKCCVILDGLDEWSHPDHCTRKPDVPHNNHPGTCTVLTTTRDWKIGSIRLSAKDIDRRVEISMLDDKARTLLEKNAIEILNERNLNLEGKNTADFDKEVKKVQIGNIIYIPYILLQLMCLFFGGLPIGKSKCEIYSNITEFTLERGLIKKELLEIHVKSNDKTAVPNCMKNNETCKRYFSLLMKLGTLAYFTLFREKKESSLIFDRKIAIQYMTEQEIEFCLKVGLLCQTKDTSIIAIKRYKVFFQHKSVQEFFSAIYITSEWRNEPIKCTILKVCASLSSIIEMSNIFVFVCGINSDVYTCISGELQKTVDLDSVTSRNRTNMYIGENEDTKSIASYQSMQVQCIQESVRNGNECCLIDLHDIVLMDDDDSLTEDDLAALENIIYLNKGNVKSLRLLSLDKGTTFFTQFPGLDVFTSLETLILDCFEEPLCLAKVLTESVRTLTCLTLHGRSPLSDTSISVLSGLTCLQSLYIHCLIITHSKLDSFYAYISQTTTLTQLRLGDIDCSEHTYQNCECDVTMNLRSLNELETLHLYKVPCKALHVNPACLEKLFFWPRGVKMTVRPTVSFWEDLRGAPVLSSLTLWGMTSCQEMIHTFPTLTQLKYVQLASIHMRNVRLRFPPVMLNLEKVELHAVKMSFASWTELFISIGQLCGSRSVRVQLFRCEGPSRKEWQTIVNVIKSTPTLSLLHEFYDEYESAFLTVKSKPVL